MATRELSSSPSMPALFARAGAAMIPGAAKLPFLGGGGHDVPDLTLKLTDASIDPDRLNAYNRVCGFDLRDEVPVTYPHILAFPLQLSLMTDSSFPFPAIGLVHIYNRIVQHRPIKTTEQLEIQVHATPVEDHPRGKQFSLISEVRVGGELVWEEISTNLKRGANHEGANPPGSDLPKAEDLPATATWTLSGDLGRRYGSVSGDLNPIHVHQLTARLFGFKSAIAHGMWTKARCLGALQARLPDAFTVEVAFKKPIFLPGKVEFCEAAEEGAAFDVQFGVRDPRKGSSHLDGRAFSGAAT
ncbi:MAG TPA: MaoC/PaaZ C-terminal domain-containing protein [Solirubrobacteraceae bacterium]|nr:MaoC/PaaZ C-terminal domain-containing protein [Solirubrobacteraceae bacterium]